jgi:hypothetical protein
MKDPAVAWRVVIALAFVASSVPACSRASGSSGATHLAVSTRIGLAGAENRGVSVAASGQRIVVVWAATTEGQTNIYSAVSEDGKTFAEPVRVNDVEGDARVSGEQPPRVALGRDIFVVWESNAGDRSRVRLARSTDSGRTFLPAITVHSDNLPGARGWASLAVDREGRAHVAWLDGRNAHVAAAAGQSHGAGTSHAQHESMRQDVFEAVVRGDGAHTETQVSSNVCFCCKTGIATGPDGATFVAWRHIYPGSLRDMAVARSDDGGRTFNGPVRVSEDRWAIDGCPEDGPSIGVDGQAGIHVVWPTLVQTETTQKAVFYGSSSDGGRSFSPRHRLDSDDTNHIAAHPQIAVAGRRVVAVWDETAAGRHRVLMRAWDLNRSRESKAQRVVSDDDTATYPAAAITADEAIFVAWTARAASGWEIRVRQIRPDQ